MKTIPQKASRLDAVPRQFGIRNREAAIGKEPVVSVI
jgi:hypothetical protein